MSVISVSQIAPGRAGEAFQDFNRSYTVPFQVIVDDARDGLFVMANAFDPMTGVSIPPRYAPYVGWENYNEDLNALCTGLDIKQNDQGWQQWFVTAKFETNYQIQKAENPEDDPVLYWIEIEHERRKVTKTWDGKDIVNSAGQLLDGIEKDFAVVTYCFLRNELSPTSKLYTYNNSVNSDTFKGMTKGTGLLKIYIDKPQRRNEYFFWPHTYKFKYDSLGWNRDIADRGTEVVLNDGTLGRPMNPSTNQPIDGEVFLDGTGKLLAAQQPIIYVSKFFAGGIPQVYQPQRFAALGL